MKFHEISSLEISKTDFKAPIDVAVYHLLSTPTSVASGSCVGFFDGEAERVRDAAAPFPRLSASVQAVGALPAVREWERKRPDTFS